MTNTELEIFEQNKKLVYYTYNKYFKGNFNITEDLLQEGFIALINSIKHYNDKLNIKFNTYAIKAIKNKMLNYLENESKYQIHNCELMDTELNIDSSELTSTKYTQHKNILDKITVTDNYNLLYFDILKCLDQYYKDNQTEIILNLVNKLKIIIKLITEGYSQIEIAKKFNVSRQRMQQYYIKIKKICDKYNLVL